MNKRQLWWYGLLAAFVIGYAYSIMFLSADSATLARYKITAEQLRLLSLTIVIPTVAIWFAAFFGAQKVGQYVLKVKGSVEELSFKLLCLGLIVLALASPITSIISRLNTFLVANGRLSQAAATIINTHLSWVFSLVGFTLLLVGSYRLAATLKKAIIPTWYLMAAGIVVAILGSLYTSAMLSNPSRTVAVAPALHATYAMNDFLIVTTIVIPNILVWGAGIYTVLLLRAYYLNVGGKLYKRALERLNLGFSFVILLSIGLQFLSAASTSVSGWGLSAVLTFVYVLLAAIAVGYVLIAFGAKGLAKLEEVT